MLTFTDRIHGLTLRKHNFLDFRFDQGWTFFTAQVSLHVQECAFHEGWWCMCVCVCACVCVCVWALVGVAAAALGISYQITQQKRSEGEKAVSTQAVFILLRFRSSGTVDEV